MKLRAVVGIAGRFLLSFAVLTPFTLPRLAAAPTESGPADLRVDNLSAPLGIDDPAPSFSWRLDDSTRGAKQTAYQVDVFASPNQVSDIKLAWWSTGRVDSPQSVNVRYAGPALKPSTRYYWRVTVWGAGGKAYPAAEPTWWETGLMRGDAWAAQWIGYETTEEAAVRHASAQWIESPDASSTLGETKYPARFVYRAPVVRIDKPIRSAALFATAQDTVAAWINGAQVLEASPYPAWHQMPWKKFVRVDVTGKLAQGANTLAIESTLYSAPRRSQGSAPPAIATLYVEYADGSTETFDSSPDWKSAIHAPEGWQQPSFDDSGWKKAHSYQPAPTGPDAERLSHPWIPDSVKALRRDFDVSKPIKSARLYSTALGDYEMFLNGQRVGKSYFAPGWSDYRERVVYQTHDVTALVQNGKNAIGALLAPGWYSTPLEWFQQPNNYGDTPPALRAQLRIEYTDGSVDWIATDNQWHGESSRIVSSELYDGETQDARVDSSAFFRPDLVIGYAKPVIAIEPKPLQIVAQDFQPIRVERELQAKSVSEPKPGVYVYDFGQNLAGIEKVRVSGPAGTDVRVRFAELVNDDGTIYTENLRTAKATDHFILAGKGVEDFTPQFTFHGFRYGEITGLPTSPGKDALSVLVLHTDAPFAAQLKTGSPMINQLWSNILWGQRSNFVGVPTDCPQRDERLGWMADAQVFWRTASYNMDLTAFSRKFARDMRGTQAGTAMYGIYAPGTAKENMGFGPGWSDAGVIIPWTSWLQTGDTRIIDENWDAMTKYVAAIEAANPDGLWKNEGGIPFGDWLSPEGRTNQVLIASASWAYDATLLREMAHATGRAADEQKYAAMFDKIRAAFQKQFVHDDGFVAGADRGTNPMGERTQDTKPGVTDTQTGYVLALHMNLVPDNLRAASAQKLVDKMEANHGLLGTGFLGTPYLLEELTKTGHADLAYQLLLNTQYPSWGYLIEHGATTTWERWNGDQMKNDPSMNSYNHYAYGAVADWIYRYAAGIDATPLDAGFHTVVLHPTFDKRLGSLDFSYPSTYGVIHSSWNADGSTATWHITIPANTRGFVDLAGMKKITLKDREGKGFELQQSPSAKAAALDGRNGFELEPGMYTFIVEQ